MTGFAFRRRYVPAWARVGLLILCLPLERPARAAGADLAANVAAWDAASEDIVTFFERDGRGLRLNSRMRGYDAVVTRLRALIAQHGGPPPPSPLPPVDSAYRHMWVATLQLLLVEHLANIGGAASPERLALTRSVITNSETALQLVDQLSKKSQAELSPYEISVIQTAAVPSQLHALVAEACAILADRDIDTPANTARAKAEWAKVSAEFQEQNRPGAALQKLVAPPSPPPSPPIPPFRTCAFAFSFAFAGALLIHAVHWKKLHDAHNRGRLPDWRSYLIATMIILCSAFLGILGIMLVPAPWGYMVAAMFGVAPLETLKFFWKRYTAALDRRRKEGEKKPKPSSFDLFIDPKL